MRTMSGQHIRSLRWFSVPAALLLICTVCWAVNREQCEEEPVTIESELSGPLVQLARDNAKAYFTSLRETYFGGEPNRPLRIYLSQRPEEAHRLMELHGRSVEAGKGFYVPSVPAVYTYLNTNDEKAISFEPMFTGIARHFVRNNYPRAPEWFSSGLVSFFSKNVEIVGGRFVSRGPCLSAGKVLLKEVRAGSRLNIKKLYVSSDEGYRSWKTGPAFTQAFLSWLYENGHLQNYVHNVKRHGYDLEVLEKTLGESVGKINIELKRYIEEECWAVGLLAEAEDANDTGQQEQKLREALKRKGDYPRAQMALARLYYRTGRYSLCEKIVAPILAKPQSVEFLHAAKLAGKIAYDDGDYQQAREYYKKAWDKARHYEYKYQIAYKLANCCHYLDEPEVAAKWYAKFLELNFRPEANAPAVKYAKRYVALFGEGAPLN